MANAHKYTVHWVFGYACIVLRSYFCVFCLMFVSIFWMSFMLELHVMALPTLHLFHACRDFRVSLLCFLCWFPFELNFTAFLPCCDSPFWRSLVGHGRPRGLGRTHSKGRYLDCHGWLLGDQRSELDHGEIFVSGAKDGFFSELQDSQSCLEVVLYLSSAGVSLNGENNGKHWMFCWSLNNTCHRNIVVDCHVLWGVIMALMGLLQLSFLVRFLSRPALSGISAMQKGIESNCRMIWWICVKFYDDFIIFPSLPGQMDEDWQTSYYLDVCSRSAEKSGFAWGVPERLAMNTVVHVHVLVMIDVMIVMISLELEVIVPNSLEPSWTLDAVFGKIQNFPLVDHMALAGNTMHGNILGSFFLSKMLARPDAPFITQQRSGFITASALLIILSQAPECNVFV